MCHTCITTRLEWLNCSYVSKCNFFCSEFILWYVSLQVSFFVSDGIDGSATSYTITYTNPRYGLICNRAVAPASQCVNGICSHHLNLSSSNCSAFSEIMVSVFGTNVLGNGTSTNPVTIGQLQCNSV